MGTEENKERETSVMTASKPTGVPGNAHMLMSASEIGEVGLPFPPGLSAHSYP